MFKKAKIRSRATQLLAVLCCLSMLVGVFAFFTDRVDKSSTAVAGNMDLVFTDISSSKTGANGITSNNEFAIDKVWENFSLVSTGAILNPGDYFDMSYSMSNLGSKSMDVRQQITLTSTEQLTADAEEYKLTITGTNNNTETVVGKLSDDKFSIVYDLKDIILNGSVETEDGITWDEETYTIRLDFNIEAGNDFMNSGVSVELKAQAKQHRNTTDVDWAEWVDFETEFEYISDTIELTSAEDVYALSRVLAKDVTKTNFLYTNPETLSIEDDFERFDIPAELTDESDKIEYLQTASYKLTNDVELSMQRASGADFYAGIGSTDYPFMGTFDGNENVVTLSAKSNSINPNGNFNNSLGFFGTTQDAKIVNTNVEISDDFKVTQSSGEFCNLGALAGYTQSTKVSNCSVTMLNTDFGVDYSATTYISKPYVGGMVGHSKWSIFNNCTVSMENSSVYAKAQENPLNCMYAVHSVGGLLGYSSSGSDNSDATIGKLGNQMYNCKVVSNNDTQKDVIIASIETGDEVCAGGLVGCTFNNFVAKNCSVEITRGNIVAEKTGTSDIDSTYGSTTGGFIGRLEHTGELYNCDVTGDYLNIISKSPNNTSNVGGIVGVDVGPYHRDVISINNCSFDGSGTSNISLEITSNDDVIKYLGAGGIVGCGTYKITGCSVKDTVITTKAEGNNYWPRTGSIVGRLADSKLWKDGEFFTPDISTSQITDCEASGITFDVSDNVIITNVPID